MNHTEAAEESVRDPGDGGAAITGNGSEKTTGKSGGANLHARTGVVVLYLASWDFFYLPYHFLPLCYDHSLATPF